MSVSSELADVQRFRDAIARRLGLYFDDTRLAFLSEQLKRRSELNHQSSEAYLLQLEAEAPKAEVRALAPLLTVAETYFFRNANQFQVLRERALPERCEAHAEAKRVRILCAGCASGEEAYSIAIAAREVLGERARDVSIRAVDLNPASLERARLARYNSWALRETAPEMRERWFRPEGQGLLSLDPSIRAAVSFEECNLMDPDAQLWHSGTYDIIFCRNVLMYFSPQGMQAVMQRMARALASGGYLFLGHAETLRGISQDFQLCHTHDTFYYRPMNSAHQLHSSTPLALGLEAGAQDGIAGAARVPVPDTQNWSDVIQRATERIRALAPASLPLPATSSSSGELAAAMDLLKNERFVEALALVQGLPAQSTRDPDVRLLHAVLLTHRLQLEEAERMCRELLADDQLNAGAHYLLALCRERAGDQRGATEHDQYAIYLDPSFAMPRLHLGLLARRNCESDLARRELAQAHILLQREDASRVLLFGGGFTRETLLALCRAELQSYGAHA
jgi:chemotaxis protein methyltransferase CheR